MSTQSNPPTQFLTELAQRVVEGAFPTPRKPVSAKPRSHQNGSTRPSTPQSHLLNCRRKPQLASPLGSQGLMEATFPQTLPLDGGRMPKLTSLLISDGWMGVICQTIVQQKLNAPDPDLMSLLYRWQDYSGAMDEPKAWVEQAVQTDDGFVTLVSKMMSRGTSQGWGGWCRHHTTLSIGRRLKNFWGFRRPKLDAKELMSPSFRNKKRC